MNAANLFEPVSVDDVCHHYYAEQVQNAPFAPMCWLGDWGLALGPAVLPGLNLMLEVPMLSLGLSSLVVLQRAFDRRSVSLAIAAGVLWGLALQTK